MEHDCWGSCAEADADETESQQSLVEDGDSVHRCGIANTEGVVESSIPAGFNTATTRRGLEENQDAGVVGNNPGVRGMLARWVALQHLWQQHRGDHFPLASLLNVIVVFLFLKSPDEFLLLRSRDLTMFTSAIVAVFFFFFFFFWQLRKLFDED